MSKLLNNYFYNVTYQIFIILTPLITMPYIARVLGPEMIGQYNYTNSIVQYFILVGCLGLNLYGQREIAYAQNNKGKYSKVFISIVLIKSCTILISLGIYLLFIKFYNKFTIIFLIQILDIIANIFDITWFYQGLENFKNVVIRNLVIRSITIVMLFLLIKSPEDIYIYISYQSITILVANLTMWINLKKLIIKTRISFVDLIKHFKLALLVFIPQIAASLYTVLDKTMIGIITHNNSEVAFYQQAQTIVKTTMAIVTSLGTVMMPRIAHAFSNKDYDQINKNMYFSFKFIFILSLPIIFGLLSISDYFVPWFFGAGYDKVSFNINIMSPIVAFIGMTNLLGTQYLLIVGKEKYFTISIIIGTITNFIFNLIFIPIFLSYGAAFGTLIAEFCVLVYQIFSVKNDFSIKIIFQGLLNPLLSSIIMFFTLSIIKIYMSKTLICTVILIIIGIIIYLMSLILLRDKFFIYLVTNFYDKICSNKSRNPRN